MSKAVFLSACLWAAAGWAADELKLPTAAEWDRIILNEGNAARLEAVFAKAARGERVSIAAIGGSITEGAGAGAATNRWSELVADWFARTFPRATVVRANAGIGATGSRLGCYRIARHVAPADPDFVAVDFSVNDQAGEKGEETMEGCVRQLLRLRNRPAVLLVSFFAEKGSTVQDDHLAVARYYSLPQLSIKNVIWPRLERKDLTWRDYSGDNVHPNPPGHRFVAAVVTGFLERRLADWRSGRRSTAVAFPAKPLYGRSYENGTLLMASEVKALENKGFGPGPSHHGGRLDGSLVATKPGDRLVFETDASTLAVLFWKLRADYGRARVTVDGREAKVLEGWFDATWGGKATPEEIYRDRPGHHRIEIEVLEETAPASKGHRFEICAILEQHAQSVVETAFREQNVPAARIAALQRDLPRQVDALERALVREKDELTTVFGSVPGTLQHERVAKRYELARRLVRCIRTDLAKGDVSSLCFAEMEVSDLKAFVDYFAAERAAWKTFPENPAVRPVELRLADFGAKGDGEADDAPAFRAAITAVKKLNGAPSVLRIPAGTFRLASPDPLTPDDRVTNLVFPALTNCLVTGVSPETTRIRFGQYDARGICVRGGYNSVFRNFEIRWQETPFFEGEILGYDREAGWIDVSHDAGTLSPVDPKWQVRKHALGLHTFRKDGSFIKTTLFFWPRRAQAKGDGTYRLLFDTARPGWKTGEAPVIGAKAVLPDRLSGFEAFGLLDARLCTVDSVWIRNSREAFLQPSRCYQCSAVRCRIFPAEGRSFSTNADGFYNSRGSWISDCTFENMGDDGCNSVMHGGDIVKVEGRTMLCKPFGLSLRPGDICQLVESTTGEYLANLHVVSTGVGAWGGKRWLRIDFAEEIPEGVHSYENTGRGDITEEERQKITLGLLKLTRPPDVVFAPGALGVGYVARNNVFRDNRNTAMVVQCPNALLEGNRASGMQNGIVVGALLQWNEGPAPYNVVLRDNVLSNNYYGIITSYSMNNGAVPRTRPIRHLSLERNEISGSVYEAVNLSMADER